MYHVCPGMYQPISNVANLDPESGPIEHVVG